jgi:glutathione S-transferase
LLPTDPWQEFQAVSLMSWCSGGIHPFLARINSPPLELDLSSFTHCTAHFERMMERPSIQKLLAFGKSIQDDFAKAA